MSSNVTQVVTITEATQMYYVARETIRYHLDKGRLVWRKTTESRNGVILIELSSLKRLWGEPPNPCQLRDTV